MSWFGFLIVLGVGMVIGLLIGMCVGGAILYGRMQLDGYDLKNGHVVKDGDE